MHDRARVKTEDLDPASRAKVTEKITKYRELVAACADKHLKGSLTQSDLEASRLLLEVNPEYYTFYNYRRRILEALLAESPHLLGQELEFSTRQLKRDYKSYCTWYHRKWIILKHDATSRHAILVKEKLQCEGLLKLDERNFHAWGYRRWVIGELGGVVLDAEELKFTETKIGNSFSNYSAWHARVPLMEKHPELIGAEVTMAIQAFYCDPRDQSTFLYMEWLLGQDGAPGAEVTAACVELLGMEGDLKWPLWMLWRVTKRKEYLGRMAAVDPGHDGFYQEMLLRE